MLSRLEDKRSTSMLYGFFCEVRATYVPASRAAKANSSRGYVETIKTNRQRRAGSTYKRPKRRLPSFRFISPDNFGQKRSFGATTGAMCSCCIRGQLCAQVGRSDTARTRLDITIGVNPCSARWSRTIYPAPLPFFRLPGQVQHNSRFRPTGVEAGKVATGPTTLRMPKAKCLKILFVLVPTTR